jgi:hypothetical protein
MTNSLQDSNNLLTVRLNISFPRELCPMKLTEFIGIHTSCETNDIIMQLVVFHRPVIEWTTNIETAKSASAAMVQ